ncbi:MAG: PQQ-binding-like beta-propeller repeat protein [Candidatus Hydrogenedentes bacterium]|nr:PQQ-binding-like beta-propeller repeat protein [Candidatus Hydrogenedentota bacterium]
MKFSPALLLLFTGLCALHPGAHAQDILWTFKPPLGIVDASPGVADMNGDGREELVLNTTAGSTLVVDSAGQQVWMRGQQIPISLPPTIVNLVEDPTPEILILNQSGRLYCMSGTTGDPIWQYDLPGNVGWGMTAIVATDLDGDGEPEVLAGDEQGHVVCLNREGELLWQYDGDHGQALCPAVGKLGKDDTPSILISGTKQALVCLNSKGKEQWRVTGGEGLGGSPILCDLDGDGKNEVVGAQTNHVIATDAGGKALWRYETPRTIDSSIAAADADEDGILEIYAIDLAGTLVSLAPDGTLRWSASVRERSRRSPAIADVDGDDRIEVVVAGYSGAMYLFTGKGELKETIPMPQNTNASPTIADFTADGTPVVIYASGGGDVVAYRWPNAKAEAKVLWPEYRFSSQRQGVFEAGLLRTPIRIAAVDPGDFYAGANTYAVEVVNPDAAALRIEVAVTRSGKDPRAYTRETSEQAIRFEVDYALADGAPTALSIACHVYRGDQLVAQRVSEAHVIPFRKELADLETLLSQVGAQAESLPGAYALLGETAAAAKRLEDLSGQAAIAGTLGDVERRQLRDGLRAQIARFRYLKTLCAAALSHHASAQWPIQISGANAWAPFGGMDEVIEGRLRAPGAEVFAFQGETEGAALNLYNWGTATKVLRVEAGPFTQEGGPSESAVLAKDVLTLHESVGVPTQTLDISVDALPEMNPAATFSLPGWDARQLWLTIKTKALPPGIWKSTLRFNSLDVQSQTWEVPVLVTVSGVQQADTKVLKHCNWGYIHSSRLKDYEEEALADRVAHGENVFVTSFAPTGIFDAEGTLTGEIDFTQHDAYVSRYAPHGMILFQNLGGLQGPGGLDGAAYEKAYIPYMRAWVAHLREMSIGYDGYAMYPVDEPGLSDGLVALYLRNAKLTRAADPKVLMYTDPVARITEAELKEMLPYVDIWCPNRDGFLLQTGAEKLALIQNSGSVVWNYECQGNAKHQSPLGYYRGQSWLAWNHGLTGIGFWTYCTSSADPWFRPTDTNDYLMIYQGDGPVSSKRWEAVRDGMEDYAMLHALREATARAKQHGTNAENVVRAEKLLGAQADRIGAFCGLDSDGTVPGKGGQPEQRAIADRRFAALQRIRQEIAALHEDLNATAP